MSQIRSNILIISKDNTNLSSALRAINSDGTIILDVNNDGTTQFGTGFKISSGGNSASVTGLFPIFDGFGGSFEAALIGLTGDISIGGSLMLNNSGFSKIYGGTNYGIIYSSVAGDQLHDFRGNVKILGSDSSSLNYALKIDNSSNISLLKISNDGRSIFNYGLSVLGTNFGHTFSGISGYSNIFTIGEEGLSNTYFKIDTGGAFQFGNIASTKIFSFDNSNFSFMTANVGIGTETPSAKLEVYGSANNYARLGSQYSTIRESASAFLQFSFNYNEDFYLYAKGIFLSNPTTNKSINNDNSGVIGASYNYNFSDYSFKSYDLSAVNYFEINHIGYYGQNRLGVNATPTATIHAKGVDSLSTNYALKIDNSSNTPLFYVRNDGFTTLGTTLLTSKFSVAIGDVGVELGYGYSIGNFKIFATDSFNANSLLIGNGATGTNASGEAYIAIGRSANSTELGIAIGAYTSIGASSYDGIAIGRSAITNAGSVRSVSIGRNANSQHNNSWAVGFNSVTTQDNEFNFGALATNSKFIFNGDVGISTSLPTARLHIKGISSTSADYALKVDNSSNTPLFYVRNDGIVLINSSYNNAQLNVSTPASPSFVNAVFGDATLSNGFGVYGVGSYGVVGYTTTTSYGNGVYGNASSIPYTGVGGYFVGGLTAIVGKSSTSDANSNILQLIDSTNVIKVNVLGNGKVGIGISIPTATLHVQGIDSLSTNYALKVDNSSNTPLLYVRNDGSVGVGGTSIYSNYKLQIIISSANDGLQIIGGGVGSALLTTDSDGSSGTLKLYNSALGSNAVVFNNNSNSYIITPYNFGVGISSPTAKLHVQGSTNVGEFVIKMTDGYGTNVMKADVGGSIYFSQSNGPNVNIGDSTLAPTAVLEIQKSSLTNNQFLGFTNTQTGYRYFFGINATTNSFRLYDSTASSDRLILDNVGQFGLGIVPINAKLHIKGADSLSVNYALKVDNSSNTPLLYVRNDGNVGFNGTSFGGGVGVLFKGFAATVPTTNPTGGVIDYVENTGSGVQKYRDTNGTIIAY